MHKEYDNVQKILDQFFIQFPNEKIEDRLNNISLI